MSGGVAASTVRMLGAVGRCFMRAAGLGEKVAIWVTESGYDTTPGVVSAARQRTALLEIVRSVHDASRTYGVSDFRRFNLRDNLSSATGFAEKTGLLTDSYSCKPAFAAFRRLIARCGAAMPISSASRRESGSADRDVDRASHRSGSRDRSGHGAPSRRAGVERLRGRPQRG